MGVLGLILPLIAIAVTIFVFCSIGLFILDGVNAKKENRSRNRNYTTMFIISMVIVGIVAVLTILLFILAALIMRSM